MPPAGAAAAASLLTFDQVEWSIAESARKVVARPVGADTVTYQLGVQRLPRVPMRPRLHDPRLPFFTWRSCRACSSIHQESVKRDTLATGEQQRRYILRWRLEKRDPTAPVSDVVDPIIVRIADSVPKRWVPYVKRAAEQFRPIFESIGLRNAIVVRMAGEPQPADTGRQLFIRWRDDGPTWDPNLGVGGEANTDYDVDPRTGEVLGASITFSAGILAALFWEYLSLADMDPRALPLMADATDSASRRLDSLIYNDAYKDADWVLGQALEYVIAHEITHALGVDHNFAVNSAYPADSLRRPSFLRRMGPNASIMGYTFFNFAAQPEDHVPPEDLLGRIGPYDRWALGWGYRPIPSAATPEAEVSTLEQWRAAQDTALYLRPALKPTPRGAIYLFGDPGGEYLVDRHRILGDDLLKYVADAIRHARRLMDVAEREPKRRTAILLRTVYINWSMHLETVPAVVGGILPQQQASYPRKLTDVQWRPADSTYQVRAIHFLLDNLFYGKKDGLIRRVAAKTTRDTTLVLFDSIPGYGRSRAWRRQQREILKNLVRRLKSDSIQPPVVTTLCREMATLDRHLTVAAADTSVPVRRQQADSLRNILAPPLAHARCR